MQAEKPAISKSAPGEVTEGRKRKIDKRSPQVFSWTGAGWRSAAPSRPRCSWSACALCPRRRASCCRRARGERPRRPCASCEGPTRPSSTNAPALKTPVMKWWVFGHWTRSQNETVVFYRLPACLPAAARAPVSSCPTWWTAASTSPWPSASCWWFSSRWRESTPSCFTPRTFSSRLISRWVCSCFSECWATFMWKEQPWMRCCSPGERPGLGDCWSHSGHLHRSSSPDHGQSWKKVSSHRLRYFQSSRKRGSVCFQQIHMQPCWSQSFDEEYSLSAWFQNVI